MPIAYSGHAHTNDTDNTQPTQSWAYLIAGSVASLFSASAIAAAPSAPMPLLSRLCMHHSKHSSTAARKHADRQVRMGTSKHNHGKVKETKCRYNLQPHATRTIARTSAEEKKKKRGEGWAKHMQTQITRAMHSTMAKTQRFAPLPSSPSSVALMHLTQYSCNTHVNNQVDSTLTPAAAVYCCA